MRISKYEFSLGERRVRKLRMKASPLLEDPVPVRTAGSNQLLSHGGVPPRR